MKGGEAKMVCVTGASGFIGSWLVKLLLQRGYAVNAAVLDPNDPKMTEHLRVFDGAKERLRIFKGNLSEEGSFDAALDGCEGVFHVASPVVLSTNDPQAEIVDPAVKGTLDILRSCSKVHSLKRVIITASEVSIIFNGTPLTPDVVVDETWFSNPDVCMELKNWYALSKTLAEQAAWKFAKENDIELITMHPVFVIGPLLQPILNVSVNMIRGLTDGSQITPGPFKFVDVRDVAYAHIQALEVPTANGRYILVGGEAEKHEVLKTLQEYYPTLHLQENGRSDDTESWPRHHFSTERAKHLGINFIPWEVSLKDTVESLKEKGFLNLE